MDIAVNTTQDGTAEDVEDVDLEVGEAEAAACSFRSRNNLERRNGRNPSGQAAKYLPTVSTIHCNRMHLEVDEVDL